MPTDGRCTLQTFKNVQILLAPWHICTYSEANEEILWHFLSSNDYAYAKIQVAL